MRIVTRAWAAVVSLVLLLSACGGGGSGGSGAENQPQLSGAYTLVAASEWQVPASISASLPPGASGTPSCQLVSGSVPTGMVLGSGCSLAGTPEAMGSFQFTLRLTLPGYAGSATIMVTYDVGGPVLARSVLWPVTPLRLNEAFGPTPAAVVAASVVYAPRPGDVLAFAVAGGTLPAGLTLDAATGTVSGAPRVLGPFEVQIGASLTRGGKRLDMPPVRAAGTVTAPFATVIYADFNRLEMPLTAATSPVPSIEPPVAGTASVSFAALAPLPAGLSLDPATGVISGRPTDAATGTTTIRATITTVLGDRFDVDSAPLTVVLLGMLPTYPLGSNGHQSIVLPGQYPSLMYHQTNRGGRVTFAPGEIHGGLPGDSYRYELLPSGAPLPSWLSIAPDGTLITDVPYEPVPTIAGAKFIVQVTTRRGGVDYTTRQAWELSVM